jgi:hypothetical protein
MVKRKARWSASGPSRAAKLCKNNSKSNCKVEKQTLYTMIAMIKCLSSIPLFYYFKKDKKKPCTFIKKTISQKVI